MKNKIKPIYYGDYLKLNQLLDSQHPVSPSYDNPCHDEMLFIVIHQVYELWFKQIIHEIKFIQSILSQKPVQDSQLSEIDQKLERIKKIQFVLNNQIEILETMSPMDFLEFRDYLVPASGFQSVQFREVEIRLGLSTHNRHQIDREYFLGRLNAKDRDHIEEVEKTPSLFSLLSDWLERMPFTYKGEFDFWKEYQLSVEKMLDEDRSTIVNNLANLSEREKEIQFENLKITRQTFDSLFDVKLHQEEVNKGERKLGQKALLNALFICLYRDYPLMALPYKIITHLIDIDEQFSSWRYRHAMLAHRMLGTKIGTGGSSGHQYLKQTAEKNRIFVDFFNISTFIIPRSKLPPLPDKLKSQLSFFY